jgi:hypothetical protein
MILITALQRISHYLGPFSPIGPTLSGFLTVAVAAFVVLFGAPPVILLFRWWWHLWLS